MINVSDTICAPATVQGVSAIAVIRVSGPESIALTDKIFKPVGGQSLSSTPSHRLRFGTIAQGDRIIDEVLVSVFRSPHSYTGEDSVEISCHGSIYIQQELMALLVSQGARVAAPGEFSQRAFLNGKMDLAQAEAVADLISSETESAHRIAMQQMKGGFSKELQKMRGALLELVSLMELELDFSEEDVEFADRARLRELLNETIAHIKELADSFKLGNVIKNGVPVAIAGATNTGKSTLLNTILGEERAIVSEIHGTTRDFIEDIVNLNGISFRFVDTAGIREASETIEMIGIERTFAKIKSASVVILMLDSSREESFEESIEQLSQRINPSQKVIIAINKLDIEESKKRREQLIENTLKLCRQSSIEPEGVVTISAKKGDGVDELKKILTNSQQRIQVGSNAVMVSNMRHYEALVLAKDALNRVLPGLDDSIPTDLLAQDLREALFHIGQIVGEINTEEILGNIFGKFCIGK